MSSQIEILPSQYNGYVEQEAMDVSLEASDYIYPGKFKSPESPSKTASITVENWRENTNPVQQIKSESLTSSLEAALTSMNDWSEDEDCVCLESCYDDLDYIRLMNARNPVSDDDTTMDDSFDESDCKSEDSATTDDEARSKIPGLEENCALLVKYLRNRKQSVMEVDKYRAMMIMINKEIEESQRLGRQVVCDLSVKKDYVERPFLDFDKLEDNRRKAELGMRITVLQFHVWLQSASDLC